MKQAQRLIMIDEPEDPGPEENLDYELLRGEKIESGNYPLGSLP